MRHHRKPAASAAIAALIAASTLVTLLPALDAGFVLYDDPAYVTENPGVAPGRGLHGLRWAFTTTHEGNWHPVTWLSHMADVSLHGLDPRGHHRTSLLLHAANAALFFLVLRRLTGHLRTAAFAALLFGLHPLHVEPATWVAERKEVLAFGLGMAALLAYRSYTARPGPARLLAVAGVYALGLMAKPVLVTLPLLLLVLDWWPLGRFAAAGGRPAAAGRIVAEKASLLLLATAASVATYLVQQRGGATAMTGLPFADRAGNAAVAYCRYLAKTLWPRDLSIFYPHGGLPPVAALAGAAAVLAALSAACVALRRGRPWLLAGWLWFLGTLVPMIGLVQVGYQSMADRYAYLTVNGVFLAAAWSLRQVARESRRARLPIVAAAVAMLAAFGLQSNMQSRVWKDSKTLFGHALAVIPDNWLALQNYGGLLLRERDLDGAMRHLQAAVRLKVDHPDTWYNIGRVHLLRGEPAAAAAAFRMVIGLTPGDPDAHVDLGNALFNLGRFAEAAAAFEETLRLRPGFAEARDNLERARRMQQALRGVDRSPENQEDRPHGRP